MNNRKSPLFREFGTVLSGEKRIRSVVLLKILALIIIFFGFLNISQIVKGQERRVIPFITGEINFDGIPDEKIWTKAESFSLVMHSPDNGRIPEQKTDIRLFFDETYLYMGVYAYYNTPENISRIGRIRDYDAWNSDRICIALDTLIFDFLYFA